MRIVPLLDGEKLSLETPGHLEVFFLGVGSAFAKKNFNTNFLLIKGKDHVLVDFGITGPTALWQNARLCPTEIKCILPTHVHGDHVGGMEQLAFMHRYVSQTKPTCIISEALQQELWHHTLYGALRHLTDSDRTLRFGDYFNILRPNQEGYVEWGKIKIKLYPTRHIAVPTGEPAFITNALCVNDQVLFTGDSVYDMPLICKHARCKAVFADCGMHEVIKNGTHASIEELRSLPAIIKAKMHLVHYSDNYENYNVEEFAGLTQAGVRYVFD